MYRPEEPFKRTLVAISSVPELISGYSMTKIMIEGFMNDLIKLVDNSGLCRNKYPILSVYKNLALANSPTNVDNRTYQFWQPEEIVRFFSNVKDHDINDDDFAKLMSDILKLPIFRKELIRFFKQHEFYANWLLSDSEWFNFCIELIKSTAEKPLAIDPHIKIILSGEIYNLEEVELCVVEEVYNRGNNTVEKAHFLYFKCTLSNINEGKKIIKYTKIDKDNAFRYLYISDKNFLSE